MLLTEPPGWNGLLALKSHICSRLARFSRTISPSTACNAAAFFDADLRYILTITLVELPENDYSELNQAALNLLSSLNDIVNEDLVNPSHGPASSSLGSPEPHLHNGLAIIGDRYPRLNSLISFLESTSGQYNLVTGPRTLFKLLENQAGKLAIERVLAWKELLERTIAGVKELKRLNLPTAQQQELKDSPESPSTPAEPSARQSTASAVIDAIFKDFCQRDCGTLHEIKLKVSDEWQSGAQQSALDMFMSVCNEMVWQEAKCGPFKYAISPLSCRVSS